MNAATAYLAQYRKPPTQLGVTQMVTSRPAAGKTIVWLDCTQPLCSTIGNGEKAAAEKLGWNVRFLSFDAANPASFNTAMQQALQLKPAAVSFAGEPYALWSSWVPKYQQAKASILPLYVGPAPISSTVPANIAGPVDLGRAAKMVGSWIVSDSAANAKVLLWNVPAYPSLLEYQDALSAYLTKSCPMCSLKVVSTTLPDLEAGKAVPAIVAALQRNPDYKYVVIPNYALITGLRSALSAAGISDVKITGSYAGAADQQLIKEGQESMGTADPVNIAGWLAVDSIVRHSEGVSVAPGDGGLPDQVFTKDTVGTPSNNYNEPSNYQSLFTHMWRVG